MVTGAGLDLRIWTKDLRSPDTVPPQQPQSADFPQTREIQARLGEYDGEDVDLGMMAARSLCAHGEEEQSRELKDTRPGDMDAPLLGPPWMDPGFQMPTLPEPPSVQPFHRI
jgi:hypothetical protein